MRNFKERCTVIKKLQGKVESLQLTPLLLKMGCDEEFMTFLPSYLVDDDMICDELR